MANQVYFDSKSLVGKDGWVAKSDSSWCQFLNDHAVWLSSGKNGSTVSGGYDFTVPTTGYYTVNGSADDNGYVDIDGVRVLDIVDLGSTWYSYVWLTAGTHRVAITGKDTGKGSYGLAVTIEESKTVFNLKSEALKTGQWTTRTNSSWYPFLRSNGVWITSHPKEIDQTWTLNIPSDGYYTVNGSCDDYGTVWIDGLQVLDIRDYKNVWSTSVWLSAGAHSIRTYGKDTGGDYAIGVSVEKSDTFFGLKNYAMRNWGWAPRTDNAWCQFLNANATWANNSKEINSGAEFTVPAKAYYTVTGSCDDYGHIDIDNKRVVDIKDFKNTWSASVLLEAGKHTIQFYGKDTGGNAGIAISISGEVDSVVDAQATANQAAATEAADKADYDAKNQAAVEAQAAVGAQVTTDVHITMNDVTVQASASASADASASAGAHAGVDGNSASAGAEAGASAGAEASAGGSATVGNDTGSISAGGSAGGYADASAEASAEAGAGLDGNNVTAGVTVDIVVRTEAGVSAEAQADAMLLGIELAEASAQGNADVYTEVYVHADGSVTVGENGATIQAGAVAGYSIGAGAEGSAGVTTAIGGVDASGGAEVSIGAQIGAEGEAHATFQDNKISIGISGEAAVLVGLDADVNVNLDLGPTVDTINAALNSGKSINEAISYASCGVNQTAVAYNKTQSELQYLADQALQVAKQAEQVYNDSVKAAQKAADDVVNATNDAIKKTEDGFKSAGNTISNGVVNLGNSIASGATSIANDIGHAMNPKNWF